MSVEKKLVPTNYIVTSNKLLLDDIQSNAYYLFVGDNRDRDGNPPAQPIDMIYDTHADAYNNMHFGKKVHANNDVRLMIRNIPYEPGFVIDAYDDQDSQLFLKDFYAIVNADAFYHVFKCLDNNMGAVSSVTPNFSHISGANTQFYQTSDGYKWKYMFSVSDLEYQKFGTTELFPVVANTSVSDDSVDGSIDNILILDTGRRYDNHLQGTFSSGTLRVNGNNRIYAVTNAAASTANDFYNGCLLSIVGGTGIGQHKTISDYFVNSSGKFLVTNSSFSTDLATDSQYELTPQVLVHGASESSTNVLARALINSSASNSIHRIEIINRGSGFKTANAHVVAHTVVGVIATADLRPILSPPGGHGSNAAAELYSKHVAVAVRLQNSESNTITTTNGFQQIGLLRNPLFKDVVFNLQTVEGTFISGETVYKINPVKFEQNVTISSSDTEVSANSGKFDSQIDQGTILYISNPASNSHMIGVVDTITSNTVFDLEANALFSNTEAVLHFANVSESFVISDLIDSTHFAGSFIRPNFQSGDILIGVTSGAKAIINNISRAGVTKNFSTFIQMYKYEGDILTGIFANDETVFQSNVSQSNGYIYNVHFKSKRAIRYCRSCKYYRRNYFRSISFDN
jgi:hypothetical protein